MSQSPLEALDAESGDPKVACDSTIDNGYCAIAAYKTDISDYNSSIAPWHGHALEALDGIIGTADGIEMQFPFPSLKKPAAHDTEDKTDLGMHPPAPSEVRLSGHLGDETWEDLAVVNGTHPPYPSDSHPSAQDTETESGIQFPSPSL